jgi:hypothetical protein|tara:strand:- start:1869 stop:3455 length:1587 start_codon:yes stop_codon:yes gene_type:complete
MPVVSQKWKRTKDSYLKWLLSAKLKDIFSKNIYYENLSLWWLTKVYEKDALNDHQWFNNLNKIINGVSNIEVNKKTNIFYEICKTLFKFLKTIVLLISIKILYQNNKSGNNVKKNCVYVQYSNLIEYKKKFIDAQYGLFSLENNHICYAIQFQNEFSLIYKFLSIRKKLKKIPVEYYIVNKYINFGDIVKIYFFTLKKFFFLKKILNKKNHFLINKKDCSSILKPLLLKSFFGTIQFSLLNGISFRNLKKSIKFKNFISYLEFFPTSRSIYYFLKNENNSNIVSINHANYSDNMLAYSIQKNEFSDKNDYLNFSPCPDIFFTQGDKYFKKLKVIFPKKKISKIGSLKLGIQDVNFFKKTSQIKKKIKTSKKILSIFLSTHDYLGIAGILNNCDLSNFFIILRPHPYYSVETIKHFDNNFQYKYHLLKEFSSREIIKVSDFIISGDSSLCYESVIMGNKNTLRVYNEKYHPLYDVEDGITIVKDVKNLEKYLFKKIKIKNTSSNKLIKKFFFKYDKHAHIRLIKILKDL